MVHDLRELISGSATGLDDLLVTVAALTGQASAGLKSAGKPMPGTREKFMAVYSSWLPGGESSKLGLLWPKG
jgi:hypothetical protein